MAAPSPNLVQEWLRVLRKANAAVVFVTQSLAEVMASPKRELLRESCPTRLLLPNPAARAEATSALYRRIGLSSRDSSIPALATRPVISVPGASRERTSGAWGSVTSARERARLF